MNAINMNTRIASPCWSTLACGLVLVALMTAGAWAEDVGPLSRIRIEPASFNPSRSEDVSIRFYLSAPCNVNIVLTDADQFPIATLASDQSMPEGTNTVRWNGRDLYGLTVPDDAYYLQIEARDAVGGVSVYKPAYSSGGGVLSMMSIDVMREKELVQFSLPKAARVSLRAGVHDGPLGKTLMDWVALPAGTHEVKWDGKDASGNGPFWNHKRFNLVSDAFLLPDNAIITTGNKMGYLEYWSSVAAKNKSDLMSYRLGSKDATDAKKKARHLRMQTLQRKGSISKHALANRLFDREPKLTAELLQGKSKSDSSVWVRIELDEQSSELLSENRYEYVVYVDYLRQEEREIGFSPYTWEVNTTGLTPGEHLITINVSSLEGQIGTASVMINVE